MDNAPNHTSNEIDTLMTERDYINVFIFLLNHLNLILLRNFDP